MPNETLIVDRLHVLARGQRAPGAAGLRMGLEAALRALPLQGAYLPPQAILVVRTLASGTRFGFTAGEQGRWRQQLAAQIGDLARQALRPDRQYVPPGANCVLFDDEAALLVCYTRDLLAGRWTWYWEQLFPAAAQAGQLLGRRLLAAWLQYPHAVPHALVGLPLPSGRAALACLDRGELSYLAHSLHGTFALPPGALAAAAPEPHPTGVTAGTPAVAPWDEWLPSRHLAGLAPGAAYVLGLGYTLAQRPQAARRPEFGEGARRWLQEAASAPAAAVDTDRPQAPGLAQRPDGRSAAEHTARSGPSAPDTGPLPAALAGTSDHLSPAADSLPAAVETGGERATALRGGSFTRLGGALYLVNLMQRLDLPAALPELADLSPWELLGGLAAGLLGSQLADFAADPLWAILAELAGLEPGQPLGASLAPADRFQLPLAWRDLLPLQQLAADRDAAKGRLRIWAVQPPYLVADLPAELPAALPAGLPDGLLPAAAAPGLALHAAAGQLLAPGLVWFVARLLPFVRCLLAQQLGQETEPETEPAQHAAALLRQPATIYTSRTHVDLVLGVEQISIPVRRAGLDRTPGWLPAWGYIVTIHFE